jgi:PAS domain S-box-containing protein
MSSTGKVPELESLRGQVANLARELAARDQSKQVQHQSLEHVMQDLRAEADLLKAIMKGTATDTGDEFFASLATHLTASLHVQYAVIGEIVDGTPVTIRTVAVASGGTLLDNFEYDLRQAPCGTGLTESFCCYEQGVQALFSNFPPLATLGADSHSGVSIRNKQGGVVGLIVVMDTKPITNQEQVQALLHVFAPRVAAELQRKHTETALQEQTQRLAHAQALAHLGSWDWEIGSGRMGWSDEQFRIFGYEPGAVAVTHETFLAALLPEDHDRVLAAMNAALVDHAPFDLEFRIVRPSGEVRGLHARGEVHRDATGHPTGMDGTTLDITERKQVEDALRASEKRWQLAVRGSTDGIWDWNIRTGDVFFSTRWKEMRGYEDHELANALDEWRSRIHPDDLDRVLQSLDTYLAKQIAEFCLEYRVQRKDDSYMWVLDRGVAQWADDGTPLRMAGSESDITERKRAEEALRESEARSRSIVETALDAVIAIDKEGRIIGWNPQAEATFGYSTQEAMGCGLSETIIPVQFRQAHAAGIQRVFQNGENPTMKRRLEFSALHRDGHEFPVEFAIALTHVGGQPVLSAFVRDITERKRAEETLRRSEERYHTLAQTSPVGIFRTDREGSYLYVNKRWCEIAGLSHEKALNHGWADATHPEDRQHVIDEWRRTLTQEEMFSSEYRFQRGDDMATWVLCQAVTEKDSHGETIGYVGTITDITERKWAEQTLRQRERDLRTVLDALPVGVWFTDATGKVRLTNPAGRRIWAGVQQVGLEGAEGHPGWWENVSSSGEPHRWALARALTKGEGTLNEELTIQCLDGTSKVIINSAVPLFEENGQVSGAIIVNQDITERKALEKDRAQTQAFLQSILENIPHIITVKDAKTLTIVQMNRAAEQVLGLDRHVLADKTLYDCLPEGEANALWATDMDALQRRTLVEMPEHVVKRKGERDRIFRTKKVPILDTEGEPQYILTISEDITERTTAEAAVRQRAEHIIRFQQARLRLTKVDHVDPAATWKTITETGGAALGVERVSIWLFNEDRSAIVCRDLYGLSTQRHEQGAVLEARHYPKYFEALASDVALATSDARTDPRTDEFREGYVPLFGITSIMDAPIHLHGKVVGVLCHEHTGPPREWTSEEQSFAASVADQVALSLEAEERALAEAALRSTKNQLQAILDHSPAVIFVKDMEGRYLLINRRYEELHHLSPDEVMGKTDDDLFDRDTADGLQSNDRKVLQTGCPLSLEETVPVDNGVLTVISTKFPLKDTNGRPYAVCGIGTDITERKRAEDALRQSHAFIRQIIDTDPNFIFTKDREGRFTLVNQAVADAYGSTVEDLVGKTDADFNRKADEGTFFRGIDLDVMHIREEQFIPEEIVTDAYGNRRWVQTVKRPILDETGRAIMVLGAATDITDRKRMEEAIRQRERDLRAAIEERERISQDLHDGILQSLFAVGLTLETSKSMMSPGNRKTAGPPLDQAIDQLNRVMHEIRNFIAGLDSDLLQGKDLPTALHHMLESLTQNHPTRVRLAVEAHAAQAISAEQSLHLIHVVQEAVSNCIRHGRAQEATVSLKMLKQGVRLSIRDNGSGFNPDVAKGTGHGLTNMAARAKKIGGRFTVLSKVNAGTRVVLDLPKETSYARR